MITVLVADDDPIVRQGIGLLLAREPDIQIVGTADNGQTTISEAESLQPDLVLMDLRMPGLDGVTATRLLTRDADQRRDHLMKVLVLTTFNDDSSVLGALRAGASGFLVKDSASACLAEAVREVGRGGAWIDPSAARHVIAALTGGAQNGTPNSAAIDRLTAREKEVLVQLARGLSTTDIARHYTVSEATIRTHVSRILMKTGARDRTAAVVLAYQSSLVVIGGS